MTQTIRIVDAVAGQPINAVLINAYSSLSVPAYRRAISFIADNLASFPKSVLKEGAKTSHRLDSLLKRRPNAYQSPYVFWRTIFFHAAHTGNGYAKIDRDPRNFAPIAFHNLLPEDVKPFRYHPADGTGPLQMYFHRPTKAVVPGPDMIHLQNLSHDGTAGMDPISLHESTLQRAATIDRYATSYLEKGTVIRGAIEIPNDMTDDQIADLRARLKQYRASGEGTDDVLIITGGGKLNNTTISPQESQLNEQTAALTKQISQITGVPPEILFELSEAKYNSSIEQQGQNVVRYCFRPWIEMAEDELSLKLLSEAELDAGLTVHINPDALLRGDTKTQEETVANSVKSGLRTRNEGRALLNLPPDPDPDSNKLKVAGDTSPSPAAPTK